MEQTRDKLVQKINLSNMIILAWKLQVYKSSDKDRYRDIKLDIVFIKQALKKYIAER